MSDTGKTMMNTIFEKLENFLKTETVVGNPIEVGNVTLVPIITVAFGLGTGEGGGKDSQGNDGSGTGGGVGCKISPNGVLVIKGDQVEMIPVKGKAGLEKMIDMVPEIMSKLDLCKTKDAAETKEE